MARLDIYAMPGAPGRGYVVDIQNELLDELRTRVVVPLLPIGVTSPPVRDLNPVFDFGGGPHVFVTQALASVPARELRSCVGSLRGEHDVITRALNILLIAY